MFAFLTFANRERDVVGPNELLGLLNGRFRHLPQVIIEGDGDAPPGTPVEDFALADGLPRHLFQAKSLGAQLDVVVVPLAFFAMFIFDRDKRVTIGFYKIGEASNLQTLRPHPNAAVDGTTVFIRFLPRLVGAGLVLVRPFQHRRINFNLTLHVHVPKAARTIDEMIQVRNRKIVVHGNYEG